MIIHGTVSGKRVPSKILDEQLQEAVKNGNDSLEVKAQGQHGIGGHIWPQGKTIQLKITGPVGQRLGAMGMPGTAITLQGNASDDVGWLNCGATITVLGDVSNGAHNAGAQGILYVQGGGGARCDTMTKQNPRFAPLQSWYFRDVGDSFAEFKAGGIAVVCGVEPRYPKNILGYRPCVGMVGGTIYFRGQTENYSEHDVQLLELSDDDWRWLCDNMPVYLKAIKRVKYLKQLTRDRGEWKKLVAYTPEEKTGKMHKTSLKEFRRHNWESEVGKGGIFGDMLDHPPFTLLPYVSTGKNRRVIPVWKNDFNAPPCTGVCPADIPSHKRFTLLRQQKWQEAMELVFQYSPFPASVCGSVCPNMCMKACTRKLLDLPLDMKSLGRLGENVVLQKNPTQTAFRVAVIGAGPAGLSAAFILARAGHQVDVHEATNRLGGKLWDFVERGQLSRDVLIAETTRIKEMGIRILPEKLVKPHHFEKMLQEYDGIIIACGIQKKDGLGLRFLSTDITCVDGKIHTDHLGRTSNAKVFAVGDVHSRGLAPHAIGQGGRAAQCLSAQLLGELFENAPKPTIPTERIRLEYYPAKPGLPKAYDEFSANEESKRCLSCALCRDCRICESSCFHGAITRQEDQEGNFEYRVNAERCIGCGFCAGVCPCGIWEMKEV